MNSNYLTDLFINEVKGALNRGGSGGSGGGAEVYIPTKLSEFENDLFGKTLDLLATFTKDNAQIIDMDDGDMVLWMASCDVSGHTTVDNVGYTLTMRTDGINIAYDETSAPLIASDTGEPGMYQYEQTDLRAMIMVGMDIFTGTPGNYVVFAMEPVTPDYLASLDTFEFKLYYKNEFKIPIDLCDTDELEEVIVSKISALEDEVNNA